VDATGGGEFGAIRRLRRLLPRIGDDAAVVPAPPGTLLLAADAVVEGVHADLSRVELDDLGWKAVVANVSDMAAMGGRPLYLLVTVCGPPSTDLDLLYRGIGAAVREYGCEVVGGDLANAAALVVTVTVVGTCDGHPVLRSGAGVGDSVFVTGPLGAAAASEWTVRPQARVEEGTAARLAGATAMIDVSDGLAADVGHLCDESGVGIDLLHVPVAEGATEEQALGGGEDYELVFTAPDAERVAEAFAEAGLVVPERIGVCVADTAVRPAARGWEHDWS
jgi:thiamine-monophosphate kinase